MLDPAPVFQQCVNWPSVIQQISMMRSEMNCGTAIVITTSFLDQCKKRQRKEKFRGFLYLFIWLDIKSKQMNRSAY
ncbi:hypothetical protein DV460_00315 [Enterococcus faecium]|nr:hypothetical protein DV460_00315 [Enterococcus faecium]